MKLEGWIATDGHQFLACKSREILEQELPEWGFMPKVITEIHIQVYGSKAVFTIPDEEEK